MRNPASDLLLLFVTCALLVSCQLLLKHSLLRAEPTSEGAPALALTLLAMPSFWLAVASTLLASVAWLTLLRAMPVSVIYPGLSLSYVLMVPAARVAFAEAVTPQKLVGVALICLGIYVAAVR